MVRRVAKDLIANDETEISEVVHRRLFQDLGSEKNTQERGQGLRRFVLLSADSANGLTTDLRQIPQELGLAEPVKVE